MLSSLCETYDVPGAGLAIVSHGAVESAEFVGVTAAGDSAVDESTVFDAASLTKPVFAATVLRLTERGSFDLDRALVSYADLGVDDGRADLVTGWQVLTHTTGLPNWRPGRWTASPMPLRFDADPGERFGYSGEGFELLRTAVESATGERAPALVRRFVLEPLEMSCSAMTVDGLGAVTRAVGHDDDGRPVSRPDLHGVNAAGSLRTTPLDYGRFLAALQSGSLFDRPSTHRSLVTAVTPVRDGIGWGCGIGTFDVGADHFVWQWGDDPGWKAFAISSPSDGLCAFTNSDRGTALIRSLVETRFGAASKIFDYLDWR